jgi:4-hydroxybenzoate polyprenyltransferase
MAIMPLLFLYATATDWMAAGAGAPRSLWLFLAATYATGLVLEIGRKIRAPGEERPGVETYTASWGASRAVSAWLASVAASAALIAATAITVRSTWTPIAAALIAVAVAMTALRFVRAEPARRKGKQIELASAVWTLAAYALLALPWLEHALA